MADYQKNRQFSIAVCYLEGEEDDANDFSYGLTEDIIDELARSSTANVVPRVDVLPFKGRGVEASELGDTFGVDYVFQGKVTTDEDGASVSCQVTDIATNKVVWSETLRQADDLSLLPGEVVRALSDKLGNQTRATSPGAGAGSDAYRLYLAGRKLLAQKDKQSTAEALKLFEKAVALSSSFGRARVGLAEAALVIFSNYDSNPDWLDRIERECALALESDDGLIDARFGTALVRFHKKDLNAAKDILEDIIQRRPAHYDGYWWLGIVNDMTGDYDDALEYYEKSAKIKPYSVEPWLYMNMTHRRRGDIDGAKWSAKRFLEVGIRALESNPDDAVTLSRFAVIYTLFGENEKAVAALSRILDSDPKDGMVLYNCASTYALLNDRAEAVRCLELALKSGYQNIREWLETDPDFDQLRETDEFKSLLARYNNVRKKD